VGLSAVLRTSENVGLGKLRLYSSCDLQEEPSQLFAVLSLRAPVNDYESQKEIPVADARQECRQAILIELVPGCELAPQGEWLVVILHHSQHVGVVAELREKRSRQRSVTVECFDGHAWLRLALERVVSVNEHLEPPVVRLRHLVAQALEVTLNLGNVRPN